MSNVQIYRSVVVGIESGIHRSVVVGIEAGRVDLPGATGWEDFLCTE